MTRAREELILSHAYQRMVMGTIQRSDSSRFLDDIPEELFKDTQPRAKKTSIANWNQQIKPRTNSTTASFKAAAKIKHSVFGKGIVL